MSYLYDFGDGWEHTIVLEEIIPFSPDCSFPKCIAAERNCPPEDVGGPPGYEDFLQAYFDSKHPDHENMVEWAGEGFDPEVFDTQNINDELEAWGRGA